MRQGAWHVDDAHQLHLIFCLLPAAPHDQLEAMPEFASPVDGSARVRPERSRLIHCAAEGRLIRLFVRPYRHSDIFTPGLFNLAGHPFHSMALLDLPHRETYH